jgi:hypothetical protein
MVVTSPVTIDKAIGVPATPRCRPAAIDRRPAVHFVMHVCMLKRRFASERALTSETHRRLK